ncbi:MAG TPA: HNH endonuclease, partial [Candidatus Janibacter merdipullorum]|nr:HNH endonuclease [Candidatus Janibacter merdipullorum]
ECLEVVGLLEAAKGAAVALQARATARFVDERDADAADAVHRGEASRAEASRRRSAARSEVALARRCSPTQGGRHVGVAATLTSDLPHTMAALTAGEISEWRATIMVRETTCLSAADRAEVDRRLATDLTRLGDRALAAAAQRACIDLDQEAVVERRRRAVASRNVTTRPAPDGMAYLSVLGPLSDVVGAYASLSAAEKARFVATGDPAVDAARAADDRGRGAWMADTALERLSGRSEGQAQPVEVGLVMSESAIVPTVGRDAPGDAPAAEDRVEVPGWGAMPGDMARAHLLRLVDEGATVWLRRLWTSPDGRDLVAMDSRRRLFTGGLRRLVELRDPTCRVPWCDAPTREVDHVVPFARGGRTRADNAMGTCQRHNLDKEQPGWETVVTSSGLDPGGRAHEVLLRTPTGAEFRSRAAPLLGHGRGRRRPDGRYLRPVLAGLPQPESQGEAHLQDLLDAC